MTDFQACIRILEDLREGDIFSFRDDVFNDTYKVVRLSSGAHRQVLVSKQSASGWGMPKPFGWSHHVRIIEVKI